jgi:hypothetical protein
MAKEAKVMSLENISEETQRKTEIRQGIPAGSFVV